MGSTVHTVLNRYASKVKGNQFTIDERIGVGYLVAYMVERVLMRCRGVVRFRRPSAPFVGAHVRLRSRANLTVGKGVTFADGSYVDALSLDGVKLGDNVSLGRNTRIEATGSLRSLGVGITVADNVGLGSDSFYGCAGGIAIGADTIVGNYVSFHSENHVIDDLAAPIRLQGVTHAGITVGAGCWIGAKVTVLDGANIGAGSVVAAGSVVTAGDYPEHGVYGGVPARLLRLRSAGDQHPGSTAPVTP